MQRNKTKNIESHMTKKATTNKLKCRHAVQSQTLSFNAANEYFSMTDRCSNSQEVSAMARDATTCPSTC
eukprot:m.245844 g.245844  ORF g.245844 m.245844 type:complete len:69 (+) comp15369_c0_seq2:1077-1283(+)